MAILLKNGLVYQEGEFINEDVSQPSSLAWTLVSWLQARKPTWPSLTWTTPKSWLKKTTCPRGLTHLSPARKSTA
ncbi:hypothetical protein ME0901_14430 [Lactobacillus delbrueckii subsp. bulgaricus]|uniref:Uncharacterized protein n=1 Tax=Lactobacillus delbrueckii subsp. bulgaricus TaxID=1585 RepID=A0AAV5PG24_LACDE